MKADTHRNVTAYAVAVALLVIGVACYAAFPKAATEEPVRLMMKNAGGPVLFDHLAHASDDRYGISCFECHHKWDGGTAMPVSCTDCHGPDRADTPRRSDALHMQCIGCHEGTVSAPVECAGCHMTN